MCIKDTDPGFSLYMSTLNIRNTFVKEQKKKKKKLNKHISKIPFPSKYDEQNKQGHVFTTLHCLHWTLMASGALCNPTICM